MTYPFELKPLNYSYEALEPYIDAATMELHHSKHLNTYITNLNNALEGQPKFHDWPLEKLISNLDQLPEHIATIVRNNGGGVYNHNLFFDLLEKDIPEPTSGPFYDAIIASFGTIQKFKEDLKAAALSVFGSGWAWLVANKEGVLMIIKTPNQDVPDLGEFIPIINLDVWEHAYYLKHQNRRPEYIDDFLNVINWKKAAANYKGLSKNFFEFYR